LIFREPPKLLQLLIAGRGASRRPNQCARPPTQHSQDQTNRCLALEATTTGRPILADITTLAVAELRLTPGLDNRQGHRRRRVRRRAGSARPRSADL